MQWPVSYLYSFETLSWLAKSDFIVRCCHKCCHDRLCPSKSSSVINIPIVQCNVVSFELSVDVIMTPLHVFTLAAASMLEPTCTWRVSYAASPRLRSASLSSHRNDQYGYKSNEIFQVQESNILIFNSAVDLAARHLMYAFPRCLSPQKWLHRII